MFTTPAVIASTAAALALGLCSLYLTTALRRTRAALADAAWKLAHDPLTGLLNRAGLLATHTALARTPQPILVLLIDLDEFKTINDTHGHETGDDLLVEVGDRINQVATLHGGTAARLSGDEYAALLPACGSDPTRVAEAFVVLIAQPVQLTVGGDIVKVDPTASVGVAVVDSTDTLDDIALHRADIAMYHAKRHGGNRHVRYTPGMSMPASRPRRGPRVRDLHRSPGEVDA
ncbi:diguanylate cyclase domain-containing protein [Micromonospora sp. NPDC049366]|uniref:diguanylate cyclase domain-containing protein n=1 Tax=Micromonospora sp. NPDC049366 TaxID=3364271 RepID=UPI00379A856E